MFKAGAAAISITPGKPQHLAGFPFVSRISAGVHDYLMASALYISDGNNDILFIANDLLFINKSITQKVRKGIAEKCAIAEKNIMITATHTHSAPSTIPLAILEQDALLPPVDEEYVSFIESKMIEAGCTAIENALNAIVKFAVANATGIGTNRHNPADISDLNVPVLLVEDAVTLAPIACMMVCNMHPTVLHQDSKLISGDFPGIARQILQKNYFKTNCPVLYHIGTAGNQSPRHVTKENTFSEATKLATILADAVVKALGESKEITNSVIHVLQKEIDLTRKDFPSVIDAADYERACAKKLQASKTGALSRQQIRTDEVNWFGAAEMLHLSQMNAAGSLEKYYQSCLPAEIQIVKIGDITFVAWQGEIFAEYGLQIKSAFENTFVITIANGDLQIYLCTEEAAQKAVYESCNSLFDHRSAHKMVEETLKLLKPT